MNISNNLLQSLPIFNKGNRAAKQWKIDYL